MKKFLLILSVLYSFTVYAQELATLGALKSTTTTKGKMDSTKFIDYLSDKIGVWQSKNGIFTGSVNAVLINTRPGSNSSNAILLFDNTKKAMICFQAENNIFACSLLRLKYLMFSSDVIITDIIDDRYEILPLFAHFKFVDDELHILATPIDEPPYQIEDSVLLAVLQKL
ncbi:MAG: hypothetical protein E7016_04405 [Alphaproteobacteria bacterium]|nr:hypothetical protein [Alphaproteobacteria bacterium]